MLELAERIAPDLELRQQRIHVELMPSRRERRPQSFWLFFNLPSVQHERLHVRAWCGGGES